MDSITIPYPSSGCRRWVVLPQQRQDFFDQRHGLTLGTDERGVDFLLIARRKRENPQRERAHLRAEREWKDVEIFRPRGARHGACFGRFERLLDALQMQLERELRDPHAPFWLLHARHLLRDAFSQRFDVDARVVGTNRHDGTGSRRRERMTCGITPASSRDASSSATATPKSSAQTPPTFGKNHR